MNDAAVTTVSVSKPPDAMVQGALNALSRAQALTVVTADDYAAAGAELVALQAQWNAVEQLRLKVLKPMRAAMEEQQAIFAGEGGPLPILVKAKGIASERMGAWKKEQDRKAEEARKLEEQRVAEKRRLEELAAAQARQKAEAEAAAIRKKAQEEAAEAQRQADELAAQGQAAEAQRRRDQAALEAQRAESRATVAQERGEVRADIREERAASVVAPVAPVAAPKVAGVATRKTWNYRIVDKAKIKPDYLLPDNETIRRLVTALKKNAEQLVGGIECFEEETVVATGKRGK